MKILTFHDIHPHRRFGINTLPPLRLKELLRFLTDHYQVIPLSHLLTQLQQPHTVALTFDDAYHSVYRYALPVLDEFKLTATVFPIAGFIGKHNSWEPSPFAPVAEHMSAEELHQLQQAGWHIGAHGYYHFPYNYKFRQFIDRDLEKTRRKFEELSLPTPHLLALPFGIDSAAVTEKLMRHFTAVLGLGIPRVPGVIPRMPVYSFWNDVQLRAQIIRWPNPDSLEARAFQLIHKGAELSGNWLYWFRKRKIEYTITFE